MTTKRFHAICRELLGEHWGSQLPGLGSILGVDPRTLQRIAAGQINPPAGLLRDIEELLTIARRNRAAADKLRQQRIAARLYGRGE